MTTPDPLNERRAPEMMREVTPEQYQAGYIELRNGVPIHRNWISLKKLENGNWIVQEAKP